VRRAAPAANVRIALVLLVLAFDFVVRHAQPLLALLALEQHIGDSEDAGDADRARDRGAERVTHERGERDGRAERRERAEGVADHGHERRADRARDDRRLERADRGILTDHLLEAGRGRELVELELERDEREAQRLTVRGTDGPEDAADEHGERDTRERRVRPGGARAARGVA